MAVEDFGGVVLGQPFEIIPVDHQNKPDLGSPLARQLVDDKHASVLVLGSSTSVGIAVLKAGTDDAAKVDDTLKEQPITDRLLDNPRMLVNGRVVMDMHLVEVKSSADSKGPPDLYKVTDTIPGDKLFTPAAKSGCPFKAG